METEPHLEVLDNGRLLIDESYQREVDEKRVEKIIQAFDPEKVGAIKVSHRDGRYYVFDGHHRLSAMRKLGINWCACIVHEGMSVEREATLFAHQMDLTVRPSPLDLFRAAVRAGLQDETGVAAILEDVGVRLIKQGRNRVGATNAISTIMAIYRQTSALHLSVVLRLCLKTWPDNPDCLSAKTLDGASRFIRLYQTNAAYDFAILEQRLGQKSLNRLMQRASDLQDVTHPGARALRTGLVLAILETYNWKLRRRQLPEPSWGAWLKLSHGQDPWAAEAASA